MLLLFHILEFNADNDSRGDSHLFDFYFSSSLAKWNAFIHLNTSTLGRFFSDSHANTPWCASKLLNEIFYLLRCCIVTDDINLVMNSLLLFLLCLHIKTTIQLHSSIKMHQNFWNFNSVFRVVSLFSWLHIYIRPVSIWMSCFYLFIYKFCTRNSSIHICIQIWVYGCLCVFSWEVKISLVFIVIHLVWFSQTHSILCSMEP